MPNKTKLLIWGSSPVLPSGRAETTRLIFEGLTKQYPGEYEIHQVALFHSTAVARPRWPIYPTKVGPRLDGTRELSTNDLFGQETVTEVIRGLRPDIVFLFASPVIAAALSELRELCSKLLIYLKVDDFPMPVAARATLKRANVIVTMTASSAKLLLAEAPGLSPARVTSCYSPADTSRFRPLDESSRRDLRAEVLPEWMPENAFVLGWVGRAYWRKQVWLLYKLIRYIRRGNYVLCEDCDQVSLLDLDLPKTRVAGNAPLARECRPGYNGDICDHCGSRAIRSAQPLVDVFLWLHVPENDPMAAWPLRSLEEMYDVRNNQDVCYTQGYSAAAALAPEDMPALYQVWDALIYLSGAEGFGLPVWEAMASSLPVIYSNFSSHAELLQKSGGGLAVDGVLQPERKTGFLRLVSNLDEAVQAVRRLYFDRPLGRALGNSGRAFAQNYSTEAQVEKWHTTFQSLNNNRP